MKTEQERKPVLATAPEENATLGDPGEFLRVQGALGIVTWIWDIEGHCVRWFGDLSVLLGLAPGTFSGSFADYVEHLHPDDVARAKQTYIDCLKGHTPHFHSEERVVWADGTLRWLETDGRAEYRDSGVAYRVMGVVRDITDRRNTEIALMRSEERFAKVFRASPAAIIVTRLSDGLILDVNPYFEEITGYMADEVIGRTVTEIDFWADPAERRNWLDLLNRDGLLRSYPARFRTKHDDIIFVQMSSARLDLDGHPGAITISRDVTEQTHTQRRAIESQTKYATVFEISPEAIAITRLSDGAIIEVNSAFVEQLGRSREETLGRTGLEIGIWASPEDRAHVLAVLAQSGRISNFHTRFVHADGTARDILISCSTLDVEELPCVVWTWRNVTEIREVERRKAESERIHREELLRLANEDPLTGLPNRSWLMQQLAARVDDAQLNGYRFAILFIDFDGFKRINDSIGHAIGDELLRVASRRLQHCLGPADKVARIGGDEFTVLLSRLDNEGDAVGLAQRMVAAFQEAFQLSSYELKIGISIGISIYPNDGQNGDDLLRSADIAMYEAKASGRGRYHFYTSVLYQRLTDRLMTERALDDALTKDQFLLQYQPRISARDGTLVGFEALLRWNHPERGLVFPLEFVALAEETGLIVKIGARVIELVCRQLAAWKKMGLDLVPVSINVSPLEFRRTELVPSIRSSLSEHGVDPVLLEVEITESSTLGADFDSDRRLGELHTLGLRVLIDDFGTGYSSLSQLQKLDVDVLKIDQSFTAELGSSKAGEVLVRTIIDMGKALGLVVVAEGVETLDQFRRLRGLGCDEMQGYLISRPLDAAKVPEMLGGFSVADLF